AVAPVQQRGIAELDAVESAGEDVAHAGRTHARVLVERLSQRRWQALVEIPELEQLVGEVEPVEIAELRAPIHARHPTRAASTASRRRARAREGPRAASA